MKMKLFSVLLICGIIAMTALPVQAATLSEISVQVGAYSSSGAIMDADFKADLQVILDQAMIAEMSGNDEGKVGYLDAFTVLLQEATAEMITAEAASHLMSMVP